MNLNAIAEKLFQAEAQAKAVSALKTEFGEFSVPEAYAIQKINLEKRMATGEKLSGYKMGLTSLAKQRDVKVFEPIRGYLLKSRQVPKGAMVVTSGRIHPRVEPEIAVIVQKRIKGKVSTAEVVAAASAIVPALEILDSRFDGFSFSLPEVIADNTSASGYVLGEVNLLSQVDEINLMGITMKHNGVVVETGAPIAVLGNFLLSVVGLAALLDREGLAIEPGMVVLTGGVTASLSFQSGDNVEAIWPTETLSFAASDKR